MTVEGDLISRCEVFDEADIDAALARFDRTAPRRGGWKTRQAKRASASWRTSRQATGTPWRRCWPTTFPVTIAVGWWARESDMVEMPKSRTCGRSPTRDHERDVDRHSDPRGAPCPHPCPLLVPRSRARGISQRDARHRRDQRRRADRGAVSFDLDDIDAAFAELDARYLAGEAAAHANTWSVITRAYAAVNRHELPATTPEWVNIDHRRGIAFAPGDAVRILVRLE